MNFSAQAENIDENIPILSSHLHILKDIFTEFDFMLTTTSQVQNFATKIRRYHPTLHCALVIHASVALEASLSA
jgi:hypothetical protein